MVFLSLTKYFIKLLNFELNIHDVCEQTEYSVEFIPETQPVFFFVEYSFHL